MAQRTTSKAQRAPVTRRIVYANRKYPHVRNQELTADLRCGTNAREKNSFGGPTEGPQVGGSRSAGALRMPLTCDDEEATHRTKGANASSPWHWVRDGHRRRLRDGVSRRPDAAPAG